MMLLRCMNDALRPQGQDCTLVGKEPGILSNDAKAGYEEGPAAEVNEEIVPARLRDLPTDSGLYVNVRLAGP